jgi:hypothetical protein
VEHQQEKFEVLMVVCMMMVLSWVLAPHGFMGQCQVSNKYAVPVFRAVSPNAGTDL